MRSTSIVVADPADTPWLMSLKTWMDQNDLGKGPLTDIRVLKGGTQNVLVRFRRGERELVFRRGPQHLRAGTNKQFLREIRVLRALGGTQVPHPTLVAACEDPTVMDDGAVFYLMEPLEGSSPATDIPDAIRHSPSAARRVGFAAIEALSALSTLDPGTLGLTDLGTVEGFTERQVSRWRAMLDSLDALEGWPGPRLGDLDGLGRWLDQNAPRTATPAIMHGDFTLANLMVDANGEVIGVVDWEMCAVGSSLLDLGWFLVTWPEAGRSDLLQTDLGTCQGVARGAELTEYYARLSGQPLDDLMWYQVLACFKFAIVLESTYARACAGMADMRTGERLHSIATGLVTRGHSLIP